MGTSAHEMLHFVLLPPSVPGTPSQASRTANDFPSSKPSYILASRIQPPAAASALTNANQPFIKRILVLPGPSKILVLSSTGVLSFWTYPEVSPAYGGSVKVGGANYVGALDLDDQEAGENEASGGFPTQGSIGRRGQVVARDNSKMVMVMGKKVVKMVKVKEEEPRLVKVKIHSVLLCNGKTKQFGTEYRMSFVDFWSPTRAYSLRGHDHGLFTSSP